MKKIQNICMTAAVALAFCACSSDDTFFALSSPADNQPVPEGSDISFASSIGDPLQILTEENLDGGTTSNTRSTMSGGAFASWATSDKISISDGTLMYIYQPKDGTISGANCFFQSKTSASFLKEGSESEGTFYAFYPADAVLGWNGTTVSTMIYTEQKYEENVENSGVMGPYMAAVATTTDGGSKASFTFGHVCSVIDVDFSSIDETVDAVAIYANSKVSIAGRLTYNADSKVATVSSVNITETSDDPNAYCNGNQSELIRVSEIPSDATFARFYVLPVAQANGFTITVHTTSGNYYTKSSSAAVGTNAVNDSYLTSVGGVTGGTACKPYYKKYNFGAKGTARTQNWMAMVPGTTYFTMLSTPGSHDSATSNCSSAAKCQSETIAQQLENGVRAFDIRPTYKYSSTITKDNLYIFHGMVNTNVLYKDAIKTMVDFLQANPTEALSVIMVKEDGTPLLSSWTDYTTEMCNAISEIHTQYTDNIKELDHSYYTLNDYRGKIFFGYRNAWDLHKTVRVTNWPDDGSDTNYGVGVGSTCTASVEDAYNTSGDSKKNVVNAMLDLASANTNKARFHYTFTSVANSITSSANTQNPAAATYIGTLTGPTGYVYSDFMGSSSYSGQTLLNAVINQNYKYVYKGRTRITTVSGDNTGASVSSDEFADGGQVYSRKF